MPAMCLCTSQEVFTECSFFWNREEMWSITHYFPNIELDLKEDLI